MRFTSVLSSGRYWARTNDLHDVMRKRDLTEHSYEKFLRANFYFSFLFSGF
jgi:hypothetical protein